jgi:hypothetical protein
MHPRPRFGTEMLRNLKVAAVAEAVVANHSAVNDCDHVTLTLEARVCSNFIPSGDQTTFRTFKGERTLKVAEVDVANARDEEPRLEPHALWRPKDARKCAPESMQARPRAYHD